MKQFLILACGFIAYLSNAQDTYQAKVLDVSGEGIPGAVVHWLQDPHAAVLSDVEGNFSLPYKNSVPHILRISSVGYKTDTVDIHGISNNLIILALENAQLEEVVVRGDAVALDRLSPIQGELITQKALAKAACCNLSESFETNASVNIAVPDAVTGAKQLEMLGLSGNYLQTNVENTPFVRGLLSTFGIQYIPGTWISSIDLSKGAGSVVNGYESMTGLINVELHKPDNTNLLFLNTYVNSNGRAEVNLDVAKKLNEKWSTGILTHGSLLNREVEGNGDGFRDTPKYQQMNLLNRWKYNGERFVGQAAVHFISEDREGGQVGYEPGSALYGFTNKIRNLSYFTKTALLFPETPYRGLGLITKGSLHQGNSKFGLTPYNASQEMFYTNLIYQDIFGNTQHSYKTGASFLLDIYEESFGVLNRQRTEQVPGVFFEYTFNKLDKTILVAGYRSDFHNLFGHIPTARFHFKQDIGNQTIWRVSAGSGFRVPNVFAEAFGMFVSGREVVVEELVPEQSWNIGTSLTYEFGKSAFILDAYHTRFLQVQLYDQRSEGLLYIYSSNLPAYATSIQAELKWVPKERWDVNLAYRYLDNKVTFSQVLDLAPVTVQKPFTNRHRWHFNMGYALPYDKWKYDLTIYRNGKQFIPGETFTEAPAFFNVNAQINRNFRQWEYYLGAENLLNFKQENPIINATNPFSSNFDAGMVWGPIMGRIIYFGTRFKMQ